MHDDGAREKIAERLFADLIDEISSDTLQAYISQNSTSSSDLSISEQADRLEGVYESYLEKGCFAKGDIVVWKERMRNKKYPAYSQAAIVVDILDRPLTDDERNLNGSDYDEQLDIKLGLFDPNGDFITFLFDSHRFKKVI